VKPALRRAGALAAAGAITGGLAVTAAMPYIRQADPLGLTPVILISILGGFALGWYIRGRVEQGAAPEGPPCGSRDT
jgi:hypothetical protein